MDTTSLYQPTVNVKDGNDQNVEVIAMVDQDREDGRTEITEYISCVESDSEIQETGDLVFDPERDMWVTISVDRSGVREEEADSLWVWEVRQMGKENIRNCKMPPISFKVEEEEKEEDKRSRFLVYNLFQV